MKNYWLAALLIAITGEVCAASPAEKLLPVHYVGRVIVEPIADHQTRYTYSWPGIYFESEFSGPAVNVKLDDDQNILNIIVDDQAPIVLSKPGKTTYAVTNLSEGKHHIRLEKRTETQYSKGSFEGFTVPASSAIGKVSVPKRKIEFIGDSFTVGYGNTSTSRDCTNEQLFETTNTQLAFGPLIAKHFNADYQINASSGFGVVRNYNGSNPDKSLLKLYPYTLNDGGAIYKEKWSPQIIVIGLGTNDFSTPLNSGEKWATREALHADYIAQYQAFIKTLRTQHKNAQIILAASDSMNGEIADQVKKIVSTLKNEGDKKIEPFIFSGLEYTGCHWHPSTADDEKLSQMLIAQINTHSDWW